MSMETCFGFLFTKILSIALDCEIVPSTEDYRKWHIPLKDSKACIIEVGCAGIKGMCLTF